MMARKNARNLFVIHHKSPRPFAFDIPDRHNYVSLLFKSMSRGTPAAIGSLIMAIL